MWYPGKKISEEVRDLFITALNDEEIKKEISKRFDENLQRKGNKNIPDGSGSSSTSGRTRYEGRRQSYDDLTSGDINLKERMTPSAFNTFGKVILNGPGSMGHENIYRKMKNRIQYKNGPQDGYRNRGDRSQA